MTITGGGYLMSSRRKVHGTGRLVVPLDGSVVTYTGLSTFGATTVVDEWKLGPIPVNVMDSQFNAWPDTGNYIARVAPLGTITVEILPAYIGIGQSAVITVTSDTVAPVGGILVDLEYGSDLDSGRYNVPLSLTITAGNLSASGTIYTYDVEVTISVTPITMDYGDSALVTVSYVAGVAPAGGTYVGLETVDGVTPDCYYYLPGEVYIAPGQASGSVVLETFVSPRIISAPVSSLSSCSSTSLGLQHNLQPEAVSSLSNVSAGITGYQDYGLADAVAGGTWITNQYGPLAYWNDGQLLPAGTYRVTYDSGAWRIYPGAWFGVRLSDYFRHAEPWIVRSVDIAYQAPGTTIGGTQVGDGGWYPTIEATEAANAGQTVLMTLSAPQTVGLQMRFPNGSWWQSPFYDGPVKYRLERIS